MSYDFSNFHTGHNRIFGNHNGKCYVFCLDCGVAGELEAISAKISAADACKVGKVEREVIGQQSKNVNKGEFKA